MWMVVGLGNPGSKYALTRHNIGFMAVDAINESLERARWSDQFKAEVVKTKLRGEDLLLLKPQTFMNLSGESVQPAAHFYKIPLDKIVVIHDEVDVPFLSMRIQRNRGHGGHNGIRDISAKMGSMDYYRLRLGVGRPENPHIPMADHVLGNFSKEELQKLPEFMNTVGDALESLIFDGFQKASTNFNK